MTAVNKTNRFFNNVYSNIDELALSPVSWAFKTDDNGYLSIPDPQKLLTAAFLWPILLPAMIATMAIAFCLAGVAALVHGLSLLGAALIDGFSDTNSMEIGL